MSNLIKLRWYPANESLDSRQSGLLFLWTSSSLVPALLSVGDVSHWQRKRSHTLHPLSLGLQLWINFVDSSADYLVKLYNDSKSLEKQWKNRHCRPKDSKNLFIIMEVQEGNVICIFIYKLTINQLIFEVLLQKVLVTTRGMSPKLKCHFFNALCCSGWSHGKAYD